MRKYYIRTLFIFQGKSLEDKNLNINDVLKSVLTLVCKDYVAYILVFDPFSPKVGVPANSKVARFPVPHF